MAVQGLYGDRSGSGLEGLSKAPEYIESWLV